MRTVDELEQDLSEHEYALGRSSNDNPATVGKIRAVAALLASRRAQHLTGTLEDLGRGMTRSVVGLQSVMEQTRDRLAEAVQQTTSLNATAGRLVSFLETASAESSKAASSMKRYTFWLMVAAGASAVAALLMAYFMACPPQ